MCQFEKLGDGLLRDSDQVLIYFITVRPIFHGSWVKMISLSGTPSEDVLLEWFWADELDLYDKVTILQEHTIEMETDQACAFHTIELDKEGIHLKLVWYDLEEGLWLKIRSQKLLQYGI